MDNKNILIYDDTIKPNKLIKKIVGNEDFSKIVYKRINFEDRTRCEIDKLSFFNIKYSLYKSSDFKNLHPKCFSANYQVFHLFSYAIITNPKEFEILMNKLSYSNISVCIKDKGIPLLIYFTNGINYYDYLESYMESGVNKIDLAEIENACFCNISSYRDFIKFLSGGFDARFFNFLSGTDYTVVKSSTNKIKMKSEYLYYSLLPDHMKQWCIFPYDYKETEDSASYTMERIFVTDMAIRWVHGAISLIEFSLFLKKVFYYIKTREQVEVSEEEYCNMRDLLYLDKVEQRIVSFKGEENYNIIANYIENGTDYKDIDEILNFYKSLYSKLIKSKKLKYISVIGHGDLCFSNILYDMETETLKLIDPKGALTAKDLWTDPFYDIAKLSHSICGLYDYFNNGLYSIHLDESLKLSLNLDIKTNVHYQVKNLFKKKLEEEGFDYTLIRLFESSLFLSMLPLHIDNPHKVFGFILNAINILKEVELCLKS